MDKSVFILVRQIWHQFMELGRMEGLVGLDEKSEPGAWKRLHATVGNPPTTLLSLITII